MSLHPCPESALDAVEEYRGLGLWPLPVLPKSKKPGVKHWSRARPLPKSAFKKWFATPKKYNLALRMGGKFLAVDIDMHGEVDGLESWQQLIKNRNLPPTAWARSGGGGWHFLFRLPKGFVVDRKVTRLGPGIDIKSEGGILVVAPSVHPDTGQPYVWMQHPREGIAAAPEWLLAMLAAPVDAGAGRKEGQPTAKAARAKAVAAPAPGDVARWVAWAVERHPIGERKTRWQTSVRLVPAVYGKVRDRDMTMSVVRGWWEHFFAAGLCESDPSGDAVEREVGPYLDKLAADTKFRPSASDEQHRASKAATTLAPEVYRRMGLHPGQKRGIAGKTTHPEPGGDVMGVTSPRTPGAPKLIAKKLCATRQEAAFVEALVVHAHHSRDVDRSAVLKMTWRQVCDIVADRHPDIERWSNKQMTRFAEKFIDRPDLDKPARQKSLLRRTYCGHDAIGGRPARPSEFEITGLAALLALGTVPQGRAAAAAG